MGLPFVNNSKPVVGVDFGADALRVLQLGGDHQVAHAGSIDTPAAIVHDTDARLRWQFEQLPALLKASKVSGKRAVCSVSSDRTIVEHLAIPKAQGVNTSDMLREKLHSATGIDPAALVVRHEEVGEVTRNGAKTMETVCFAIPRAVVREHMRALKKCGLDTVGVHCEHAAFHRGMNACAMEEEGQATLLLDLGRTGVRAVVTHAGAMLSARTIKADLASAVEPQVLGATGTDGGPVTMPAAAGFMTSSATDTVAEELGQGVRYCGAVRTDAPVKHAVFAGVLSTNDALCEDLAKRLRLPAHAADPMASYVWAKKPALEAPGADEPKPGWGVALGLCLSPTDL